MCFGCEWVTGVNSRDVQERHRSLPKERMFSKLTSLFGDKPVCVFVAGKVSMETLAIDPSHV